LEIKKPKVHEGWDGKPKGLLQVLWERGWIDNSDNKAYQNYTITGRKDEFHLIIPETSLKHLTSSCVAFEETMLQSVISSSGIEIDRSPKCHCKIAEEGIGYSWGCVKNFYCRLLLEDKRGKEKFLNGVRLCMSNKVLICNRIQKFAK
jgi:hypothetical protein